MFFSANKQKRCYIIFKGKVLAALFRRCNLSDFAFNYFNSELDNLAVPELTQIFEKVKTLLSQKTNSNEPGFKRQLGGLEEGFYMAPDFDETPECFKEYM